MLRISILIFTTTLVLSCGQKTSENSGNGHQRQNNSSNQESGGITSAGDPTSPIIVSGEIEHQRGVEHTYDQEFTFTSDSHATVRLIHYNGQDSASRVIKEIRFSYPYPTAFPFAYAIGVDSSTGPLEKIFEQEGTYAVQVKIHSHAGDDIKVGDLISETSNVINKPTTNFKIFVTGVEDCAADNAGGFCTTNK